MRLGDYNAAQMHRSGLVALLRAWPGMRLTQSMPYVDRVFYIKICLDLPAIFRLEENALGLLARVQKHLIQMQSWYFELRSSAHGLGDSRSSWLVDVLQDTRFQQYIPLSATSQIPVEEQHRFHFAVLFTITSTMFNFRDNEQALHVFVQMLFDAIASADPVVFVIASDRVKLPPWVTVQNVVQHVYEEHCPHQHARKPICDPTPEEVLDVVNLVMMFGLPNRLLLLEAVESWLLSRDDANLWRLSPQYFINVASDVTRSSAS
jgi:hypothetical protein